MDGLRALDKHDCLEQMQVGGQRILARAADAMNGERSGESPVIRCGQTLPAAAALAQVHSFSGRIFDRGRETARR
jgi:hypothetical protein